MLSTSFDASRKMHPISIYCKLLSCITVISYTRTYITAVSTWHWSTCHSFILMCWCQKNL